jgi:hypothetical protein
MMGLVRESAQGFPDYSPSLQEILLSMANGQLATNQAKE